MDSKQPHQRIFSFPALRTILVFLIAFFLVNLTAPLSASAASSVALNWNTVDQTIDGFGASGAFQRATYLMNFPDPGRTAILDALFSQTSGAGLSIVRNIVGDGSTLSDGVPTIEPSKGTWVWTGDEGQIWLMQQAASRGESRLYEHRLEPAGLDENQRQRDRRIARHFPLPGLRRLPLPLHPRVSIALRPDHLRDLARQRAVHLGLRIPPAAGPARNSAISSRIT